MAGDGMDSKCPICLADSYLNPNLKLLLSVCSHRFCETCINRIFMSQTVVACPVCKTPLRRASFVQQSWEDRALERENTIRRRVLRDYNKRQEDFKTLKDYNDYLEEVEDIIFNLANNIEVEETNKRIAQYKEENQGLISMNLSKKAEEDRQLAAQIAEEERQYQNRRQMYLIEERKKREEQMLEREEMLEGLAKGTITATTLNQIKEGRVAKKPRIKQEELPPAIVPSAAISSSGGATIPSVTGGATQKGPSAQPTPYSYKPNMWQPTLAQPKPMLPTSAAAGGSAKTPMQGGGAAVQVSPEVMESRLLAGGFKHEIVKKRALEEAFSTLFITPATRNT